jgi:hypothetical protein
MAHCSTCNVTIKVGDKHRKCVKHRQCSRESPCVLDKDKPQDYWDGVAAQILQADNLRKSGRSTVRKMPPLAPTKSTPKSDTKEPEHHDREGVGSGEHSKATTSVSKVVSKKVATSVKTGGGRRGAVKCPVSSRPPGTLGLVDPLVISPLVSREKIIPMTADYEGCRNKTTAPKSQSQKGIIVVTGADGHDEQIDDPKTPEEEQLVEIIIDDNPNVSEKIGENRQRPDHELYRPDQFREVPDPVSEDSRTRVRQRSDSENFSDEPEEIRTQNRPRQSSGALGKHRRASANIGQTRVYSERSGNSRRFPEPSVTHTTSMKITMNILRTSIMRMINRKITMRSQWRHHSL